jgi:hypothetical protein
MKKKYNIYQKTFKILDFFPTRILRFKKTKWKKFKRLYKYFLNKPTLNNFKYRTFNFNKKFIKIKFNFKNNLLAKTSLLQLYNKTLSLKRIKKNFKNSIKFNEMQINLFIKELFTLNILLWKLNIFNSVLEASSAINNQFVYVNNNVITSNYTLKKGDIISLNYLNFIPKINTVLKTNKVFLKIYSFIDFDFYLGKIVILKNYSSVSLKEFNLILPKLSLQNKLYNYVSK